MLKIKQHFAMNSVKNQITHISVATVTKMIGKLPILNFLFRISMNRLI